MTNCVNNKWYAVKKRRKIMNKKPIYKDGESDDVNYDDDLVSEYGDVDEVDDIDDLEGF